MTGSAAGPWLAVDAGSTALKVALVGPGGRIDRVASAGYPTATPEPGWAEQDPTTWWSALVEAVRQLGPAQPAGIALTGQMQDLVPIGRGGALGAAILYSDQRAAAEHDELAAAVGGWSEAIGSDPDATNLAAKWRWLTAHDPRRAAATEVVLFGGHSALVHRLTGRAVCDPSTAATTGLYDVRAGRWWTPIVDTVGIPVPQLIDPGQPVGTLLGGPAGELGLPPGIPVVHGPGDAVATTLGVVGPALDQPYVYLGTSGWVAAASSERRATPAIWLPGRSPRHWVAAAPLLTAGAAADWARRALLGGADHATLDSLAASTCAAADGVAFLPHLDGRRAPHADPMATGVLIGVRRSTGPATIAAAVYEGIAHAVRAAGTVVAERPPAMLASGGLSASPVCLQILADVLGVPVSAVDDHHAALLGAWSSVDGHTVADAGRNPSPEVHRPRHDHHTAHRRLAPIVDSLTGDLAATFIRLGQLRADQLQQDDQLARKPQEGSR